MVQEDSESYALARSVNADHPICYALTKQSIEEASALLLGGLPEVRRQWQAETGNDPCRVSQEPSLFTEVLIPRKQCHP